MMSSILKKIGVIVFSIIGFLVAKALVQLFFESQRSTSVIDEDAEAAFYREAAEQGVESGAAKEIMDSTKAILNNKAGMTELEIAYGDANKNTIKEIRIYLDGNPKRKAIVGYAVAESIAKGVKLPMELDEYTTLTGLHYSETTESLVYHYVLVDEIVSQFEGEIDTLQQILFDHNRDATCNVSLDLLGQGFDMTYSYRDSTGRELFSVVRTHEDCEVMGYNEHS